MKKSMRVTIDVVVEDLPLAERQECADLETCSVSELPDISDAGHFDIADLITGTITDNAEMFGGSGLYVRITSAKVVNSDWQSNV